MPFTRRMDALSHFIFIAMILSSVSLTFICRNQCHKTGVACLLTLPRGGYADRIGLRYVCYGSQNVAPDGIVQVEDRSFHLKGNGQDFLAFGIFPHAELCDINVIEWGGGEVVVDGWHLPSSVLVFKGAGQASCY